MYNFIYLIINQKNCYMNVILIIFLLIIFLVNISNNAPLSGENIINFELNNNITQIKQKIDFFHCDKNIIIT